MKKLYYILLILASPIFLLAEEHTLTVQVTNIKNSEGWIFVGVYKNIDNVFKDPKSVFKRHRVNASVGTMEFKFYLHSGEYAVAVYHDLNDNKTLDKNAVGYPIEPCALSGNAKLPIFDKAKFELKGNHKISIKL